MLTKIRHNLWVGDLNDAEDTARLTKLGITSVLTVANECALNKDYTQIKYLKVGLIDDSVKQGAQIELATKVLTNLMDRNENVLVHCSCGICRSPFIIAKYLSNKLKISLSRAYALVRDKYKIADENTYLN